MKIYINNQITDLPNDFMTLGDLIKLKNIKSSGTAIALNDKIIRKDKWDVTNLSPLDHITIITGAFGG